MIHKSKNQPGFRAKAEGARMSIENTGPDMEETQPQDVSQKSDDINIGPLEDPAHDMKSEENQLTAIPPLEISAEPEVVETFNIKSGENIQPVLKQADQIQKPQITEKKPTGQISQSELDRLEGAKGPNLGTDLGPEEIMRARDDILQKKRNQSMKRGVSSSPEQQSVADPEPRKQNSFTVEVSGTPELSDGERATLVKSAKEYTRRIQGRHEKIGPNYAPQLVERAINNGILGKNDEGQYYPVVDEAKEFVDALNNALKDPQNKIELVNRPSAAEKRTYVQLGDEDVGPSGGIKDEVRKILGRFDIPDGIGVMLAQRDKLLKESQKLETGARRGYSDEKAKSKEGITKLEELILAKARATKAAEDQQRKDKEFEEKWLYQRPELSEESKVNTVKRASSGEVSLKELLARTKSDKAQDVYKVAIGMNLLHLDQGGNVIFDEENADSKAAYDHVVETCRQELVRQSILEVEPSKEVKDKLKGVYEGNINELLVSIGDKAMTDKIIALIEKGSLYIDKDGVIKISEHDGKLDELGDSQVREIREEAKRIIEKDYLEKERDPRALERRTEEYIQRQDIGKALQEYIKNKQGVERPPERGFWSKIRMRTFNPKGYEEYRKKLTDYNLAQNDLRQAEAMHRNWTKKEQRFQVRILELESDLREYIDKMESGDFSKREWTKLKKLASKLYTQRSNINDLYLSSVAAKIEYKGNMPGMDLWSGLSPEDISPEVESEEKKNIIRNVDYDTRGWLAKKLGIDALSAQSELTEEYRALFRMEQAGETIRDLAIARVAKKATIDKLRGELALGRIDHPGKIFQLLEGIEKTQLDEKISESGVDAQLNAYAHKKFFDLLGRELRLHFKKAFNMAITDVGEDFEVTLDTRISDLLDNGQRVIFTSPINFFRRSTRSIGIGGRYTKHGYDWLTNEIYRMSERLAPEAAMVSDAAMRSSDIYYATDQKLREAQERAMELRKARELAAGKGIDELKQLWLRRLRRVSRKGK